MSRRAESASPLDYARTPQAWPNTRLMAMDLAPYLAREFSQTLRRALEGRSPTALASEAGIGRSALYNYLDGRRWASLDAVGALATVLDVNLLPTPERQLELRAEFAAEFALDATFPIGLNPPGGGGADFEVGGVEFELKVRRTGEASEVIVTPLTPVSPVRSFVVILTDHGIDPVHIETVRTHP